MRFYSYLSISLLLMASPAKAEVFSNITDSVDFPAGAISFADELVDFSPGIAFDPTINAESPLPQFRNGENTLGVPDVSLLQSVECDNNPSTETCRFASLGLSGSLTVRFIDNVLTGSGNDDLDLWIFEAGPPDITFVDISSDGVNWIEVGEYISLGGVDIDAFGFGPNDSFSYVRLRDKPNAGQVSGPTLGADIDAIGAISTRVIPLPPAVLLFASALALLARQLISRR